MTLETFLPPEDSTARGDRGDTLPPPPTGDEFTVTGQPADGPVAGDWQVWRVGTGEYMMVWHVPTREDDRGNVIEAFPIGFSGTLREIVDRMERFDDPADIARHIQRLTPQEASSLGLIRMGEVADLNNTSQNPWDGWIDDLEDAAVLTPWILDPEITALRAAAWLEGREIRLDEYVQTEWWQTHTPAERNWLQLHSADPASAQRRIEDQRLMIAEQLRQAGLGEVDPSIVNFISDRVTRGTWSEPYAADQIRLLVDPAAEGSRDADLFALVNEGPPLRTTQRGEEDVRNLVRHWLGPEFGDWEQHDLKRWAGRVRQNPEAINDLTRELRRQRLSLFPAYENEDLAYEDIAAPWRRVVTNAWGQRPDESDPFFIELVRDNDMSLAQRRLTKEGLQRGVGQVVDSTLGSMIDAFGSGVIPSG